jgi:hypothetical protein
VLSAFVEADIRLLRAEHQQKWKLTDNPDSTLILFAE